MLSIGDFKIYSEWLPGVRGHLIRVDGPDRETKCIETAMLFTTSDFALILLGGVKTVLDDPFEIFEKTVSKQQGVSISIGLVTWGEYANRTDTYYIRIKGDDVYLETYVHRDKLEIFSANVMVAVDKSARSAKVIVR